MPSSAALGSVNLQLYWVLPQELVCYRTLGQPSPGGILACGWAVCQSSSASLQQYHRSSAIRCTTAAPPALLS